MEIENKQLKFNLWKYIKLCLRYWYYFVISVICVVMLALAYLYIRKPAYEVDAQLMLPSETFNGGVSAFTDMANSFSLGDMFGGSSTENEIMVMKSYTVMRQTAVDLSLNVSEYEKRGFLKWLPVFEKQPLTIEFNQTLCDTLSKTLLFRLDDNSDGTFDLSLKVRRKTLVKESGISLPATINTPYGEFTFAQTEYYGLGDKPAKAFKFKVTSYGAAGENWGKLVKVFTPNKKADFIGMSVIITDPKFGKLLLNTIIDNYNMFGNEKNDDKNNKTLEFINKRIASLELELADAEEDMESFKIDNKLTDIELDASTLLQKANVLDASLLQAQTENQILQNTRAFLNNPDNNYALIPSLSGGGEMSASASAASNEIASYNELIMERMKMLSSAKGNNASVKLLNEQIDALRANIITSVNRALDNSNVKLERIRKENALTQSRMGSIPTLEKEYIGIKRTLALRRQLYLFLLRQREETQMSLAKTSNTLITVDKPYTMTEAPGLSTIMVLFLAVMIGGLIPLFLLYYTKMSKVPITTPDELVDLSQAPLLGSISKSTNGNEIVINDTDAGESIRMLRSNLLFTLEEFDGKIVLVTSAYGLEGKTYVATNLAASMAMLGKRTLIVDANFRDPRVASVLQLSDEPGLAQILTDSSIDCASLIQQCELADGSVLSVLPAGAISRNPADLLGRDQLDATLTWLKGNFDIIIVDTAALMQYSDTFALADSSDMTLCIVELGSATSNEVHYTNSLYAEGRLKRIAMVANGVKA